MSIDPHGPSTEIGPPSIGGGTYSLPTPVPVDNVAPPATVSNINNSQAPGPSLSVGGSTGGTGNSGAILAVIGIVILVFGLVLLKKGK